MLRCCAACAAVPLPSAAQTDGTQAPPPKKLAIVAESEEEKYEYETTPKCLACASEDGKVGGKVLPKTDKVSWARPARRSREEEGGQTYSVLGVRVTFGRSSLWFATSSAMSGL